MGNVRVIEIRESVFADNDATSKAIREKNECPGDTILKCHVRPGEWKNNIIKCIDQQNKRAAVELVRWM